MTELEPSAEEQIALGNQRYRSGDFDAAASAFARAAATYQQRGESIKAAEAANNQAVALLQLDRADEAIECLLGTPDVFEAADSHQLAAQAHGNLGQALAEAGRAERAEEHYQRAIAIFQQIGDQENLKHTARSLSQLQLNQGDTMSALASMQRGLENSEPRSLRDRLLRWLLRLPSRFLPR